jgi:type II secretory pathway pseudopilin PulG
MQSARTRSRQGGYTLAEALVVLTIIGLITGVTVPAFMNYLRSNRIRSSATYFQTALRYARQRAVTKHIQTRVSYLPNTDPGQYTIWEGKPDASGNLSAWTATQPKVHYLDDGVTFANDAAQPVNDYYDGSGSITPNLPDGQPDIIFGIDGSAVNAKDPTLAPGTVWLKTKFKSVNYNQYKIQLMSVGTMQVTATHG